MTTGTSFHYTVLLKTSFYPAEVVSRQESLHIRIKLSSTYPSFEFESILLPHPHNQVSRFYPHTIREHSLKAAAPHGSQHVASLASNWQGILSCLQLSVTLLCYLSNARRHQGNRVNVRWKPHAICRSSRRK